MLMGRTYFSCTRSIRAHDRKLVFAEAGLPDVFLVVTTFCPACLGCRCQFSGPDCLNRPADARCGAVSGNDCRNRSILGGRSDSVGHWGKKYFRISSKHRPGSRRILEPSPSSWLDFQPAFPGNAAFGALGGCFRCHPPICLVRSTYVDRLRLKPPTYSRTTSGAVRVFNGQVACCWHLGTPSFPAFRWMAPIGSAIGSSF